MPEPEYRLYVAALLDKVHKLIEPLRTLKHKRFRSFSGKCFRFFSGLFPVFFQNDSGIRPEKHQKQTEKKAESFKFPSQAVLLTQYPLLVGKDIKKTA